MIRVHRSKEGKHSMIRSWQDKDENFKAGIGLWWASYSVDGHVVTIRGGYKTEKEAIAAVDEISL
jgi:hypothetical protein